MSVRPGGHWETAVVWFRRDLRLVDNPSLSAAVRDARRAIPVFVLDDRLLGSEAASPARTWFLARSLLQLDAALRVRGSGLLVIRGRPEVVIPRLAHEAGADVVLAARDVTPLSYGRDRAVSEALARDERSLRLLPGSLLAEPEELLSSAGSPYAVFSPFWRALQKTLRRDIVPAPGRIETPSAWLDRSEDLASMADVSPPVDALPDAGEAAAQQRLDAWVRDGLFDYGEGRNRLDGSATSHLGADLHLGLLSPLYVETAALEAGEVAAPFVRQLAWREFYQHVLFHRRTQPRRVSDSPLLSAFRAEADDPEAVQAWRDGQTGIPVVDAAMRQLRTTAWMGNRARLVVASFLTRHLLMHYRIGERHFLRHLIDGDVANNLGGWEWSAGVGADAQPWFRIFNPVLQGRRFDPDGAWVRRWLPELASIPTRYVHAPWEMPEDVASTTPVRLGTDYPRPIVSLPEARQRALAAFKTATADDAALR